MRAAQEEIRQAAPGNHCWRLIEDPWACEGCPYSPMKGANSDFYRALDRHGNLMEDAFRLQSAVEAGVICTDLTCEELEILTVLRRTLPIFQAKIQAELTAASVSRLFAPAENR